MRHRSLRTSGVAYTHSSTPLSTRQIHFLVHDTLLEDASISILGDYDEYDHPDKDDDMVTCHHSLRVPDGSGTDTVLHALVITCCGAVSHIGAILHAGAVSQLQCHLACCGAILHAAGTILHRAPSCTVMGPSKLLLLALST